VTAPKRNIGIDALVMNLDNLSDHEREDVFGATAAAWYDLTP